MYIYVINLHQITRAKRVRNGEPIVVYELVGRKGMRMNYTDGYKLRKYK